jgi:2-polyprenyl-3-methyl-5-hydroxy-6-metoxy-1,4-benzoquinol methylase
MNRKYNVVESQSDTSNSTVASIEGSEDLAVTWERLIPKQIADDPASQKIFDIHFRRYETAARYVRGKKVLDIACGAGYGSQMLGLAGASAVVGVDISPQTVQYASQHYQTPGVEFICADAEQFEWPDKFDVIVSFETIEHLQYPDKFLERIHSLLVPDGNFILSVPLGETRHVDRYHLHAFSQEDVFDLLEKAGFSVDRYRVDDWFMTRSDLLTWSRLYPAARPSFREQYFTRLGWLLIRDFVFRGGVPFPQLLVAARTNDSPVVKARGTPQRLE